MSGRQKSRGRGPRRPRGRPASAPTRVGESLTLDVGKVAHGGLCVARHEGQVVFVRHALPGERVIAEVTDGTTKSRFLRADAVQILRAAPQRVTPACPWSGPGQCGGCDWQHTSVDYSRELKAQVVREQLQRLAGIDRQVEVEALPGESDGLHWRTRVELAIDPAGRSGLRAHRSHRVVPVEECAIAVPQVAKTGAFSGQWPPGVTGVDVVVPGVGEPVMVTLPELQPTPSVRERVVTASHGTHDLDVSARGFWQVHPAAASTFVEHVLQELEPRPDERVLDLYCGVGVFATFLADRVGPDGVVVGVEGDERATEEADTNLASARADVHLVCGDVGEVLASPVIAEELGQHGHQPHADLVVLDPPRTGAGRQVLEAVAALTPRAMAYVSCDPAALARDLSYAAELGYELHSLRAFDAFPMTHHVECIAVLRPHAGEPMEHSILPFEDRRESGRCRGDGPV
ncbi:class I SAM-dependent RNA methyltransferase [Leekyejoonella antrihumi]|uniref:Class I SAM-dependent RNA methyltransferase n=1 Tax=Leekyejoonella antrihumi TaxID=1660198 RepID=A0A563E3X2_9MICO|nr:TRAM domain-containing protein [Leekyejoonella antrihumi]TWP36932.1 class I SAM-dependent RNA methyltransferase [Leekyejoonella antrihumi]